MTSYPVAILTCEIGNRQADQLGPEVDSEYSGIFWHHRSDGNKPVFMNRL